MRSRTACLLFALGLAVVAPSPVRGSGPVGTGGSGDGYLMGDAPCVARSEVGALRSAALYGPLAMVSVRARTPDSPSWTVRERFAHLPETASADTALTAAYDPWTGFDKVQHATFSLLWVLGSQYVLENKAGWSERSALPYSVGVTATLGLAKELYDWRISSSRYFSRRDLVADAVGIAAGIVIIIL